MVVKINGMPVMNGEPVEVVEWSEVEKLIENQKKLRRLAITWWTMAGCMMVTARSARAATADDNTGTQLMWSVQDIVLMFGGFAFVVGLILFAVKRKWGVKVLQVTGFVSLGSFLAPAALLILAIIGMSINDHLQGVLEHMRHQHA